MNEPTPNQDTSKKKEAIAALIADIVSAWNAGKILDENVILQSHPDLMPELKMELEKVLRVQRAKLAAEEQGRLAATAAPGETDAARMLSSELSGSNIKIPGYSVIRELARGGQAVVLLARQLSTGRKVAVKVLREGPLADERAVARYTREVEALAALNHPNIVSIIDTGLTSDGSRFITMSYIAGHSLEEYMKYRHSKDPSDPSRLLRLFLKICAAVNVAHMRGIIHRDLKPSNIRIDERGEPHILDFGLARTAMDRFIRGSDYPVSITGEFLGSLPWSSPEQAEGNPDRIDVRTDVYSLGVILYQILTQGNFPYEVAGNIRDILNNILTAEPTPPSKRLAASQAKRSHDERRSFPPGSLFVNEAIERIVLKALAKKREARYQNAGELGRDIANYLSGQRTNARSPETEPSRRHNRRLVWISGISAAILILITAIGHMVLRHHTNTAVSQPQEIVSVAPPETTPAMSAPSRQTDAPAASNANVSSPQDSTAAGVSTNQTTDSSTAPAKAPTTQLADAIPQGPPADARPYESRHYKFFPEPIGWTAAASRCSAMGGYLATAGDANELAFLQNLKGNENTAWLGGSADDAGNWTWTNGNPIAKILFSQLTQPDSYRWVFISRSGHLASRPENGKVEGAEVPMIQGFFCEWDR